MTSLWGKLPPIPKITTPSKILVDQLGALQEDTNGIIVGEVVAAQPRWDIEGFAFELRAIVPSLINYRVRLVHVEHGILSYPCRIVGLLENGAPVLVTNEEQFVAVLGHLLSDGRLMELFSNLIAQSIASS